MGIEARFRLTSNLTFDLSCIQRCLKWKRFPTIHADPVDAIVNKSIKSLLQIDPDEKFLWYSPHSGFGNQLVAFRNALRAAGILNR